MPYRSEAQSRFIHAKANEGVGWAKKFVADAHGSGVPRGTSGPRRRLKAKRKKRP